MMEYYLQALQLVDALPEPEFDNLTQLAVNLFGTPVSIVSIVEYKNDRQFFKSQVGLAEPWATDQQTPLSHSFCRHVVEGNHTLCVENARLHPLLKDNPSITELGVIAYLGAPIHHTDGSPIGALCVIDSKPRIWSLYDIDTLKRLASCVSDTIRMKAAVAASETLHEEQAEFAYAISHDLRAPINSLHLLFGELAELPAEAPDDERQYLIGMGLKTIDRAGKLIRGVLEYTQCVDRSYSSESVSLSSVMSGVLQDLRCDIQCVNAQVNVSTLPSIQGNPLQLRMLLQNLVSNAIKYHREGVAPLVDITASQQDNHLELSVTDNGIGLAEEHHHQVFKLFNRLHTKPDCAGNGLGLSIGHRIVSNHGGTIALDSTLGEGSTFTVRLPNAA